MSATTTTCLELVLPAAPSSVRRARTAAGAAAAEVSRSERLADDVRLCVSEAVTNVVRHAYVGVPRGDLALVVEARGAELDVVVRDSGKGMTPMRRRRIGGYGLKIIERLAHRCELTSKLGAGTEVRMVFKT